MQEVTVVGLGGVGVAVAAALIRGGARVRVVERSPEKLAAARARGLRVDAVQVRPAEVTPFEEWQPPADDSPVLLCTKCYHNAEVLARLPPETLLVPVQNGFDPRLDARPHPLEAIASFVSECAPREPSTRITRAGELHLGHRRGFASHPWEGRLRGWLAAGGLFAVRGVPVIEPYKYTKLMYNAAISPLAAAAGVDNGQLLSWPLARGLFFDLLQENYAILRHAGVELGTIGPLRPGAVAAILRRRWLARLLAFAFEPSLRGTYCSMAPDLPDGPTEIRNYNQHLVDLAERAGDFPCPLNRAAVALIESLERNKIAPHRGALGGLRVAGGVTPRR